MLKRIIILSISLVLMGCLSNIAGTNLTVKVDTQNIDLKVKVADTAAERAKGLMHVKKLHEGQGMYFVFPQAGYHSFWMKNTLIPLDVIFLSEDNIVIDFVENMVPCVEEEVCLSHKSRRPAKYALEVNAGFIEKYALDLGHVIEVETNILEE